MARRVDPVVGGGFSCMGRDPDRFYFLMLNMRSVACGSPLSLRYILPNTKARVGTPCAPAVGVVPVGGEGKGGSKRTTLRSRNFLFSHGAYASAGGASGSDQDASRDLFMI